VIALLCFVLAVLTSPFGSKRQLEAENAALRHQLIVLRRKVRGRPQLTNHDRWFFVRLYRWFPSILKVLTIIEPETLVRWHRAGFRYYWRWKSGTRGGRPQIDSDLHALIKRMSIEKTLWGAPRIHSELLKLGFEVAQSSVAKYMVKQSGPPSQRWKTILRNHAPDIAAMDLFVVPTISFDLLYALVIVRLDRRDLVWINVTTNRTTEWIARQITEAFPWDDAPEYLIRDRDRICGILLRHRLRTMGLRESLLPQPHHGKMALPNGVLVVPERLHLQLKPAHGEAHQLEHGESIADWLRRKKMPAPAAKASMLMPVVLRGLPDPCSRVRGSASAISKAV
jgi:hypothetical protein